MIDHLFPSLTGRFRRTQARPLDVSHLASWLLGQRRIVHGCSLPTDKRRRQLLFPMQPDTRKPSAPAFSSSAPESSPPHLTSFGGVTHQGPHTNLGWLSLMLAMGCLPTGLLTLLLAALKLLGDRRR
jgi:hypothetical protein